MEYESDDRSPHSKTNRRDLLQRKGEAKRRALPGLAALGPDAAAVVLDDFLADGQAEAGAVRLAVRGEGTEEGLRDFRRDAATGILDLDPQFVSLGREAQQDAAA